MKKTIIFQNGTKTYKYLSELSKDFEERGIKIGTRVTVLNNVRLDDNIVIGDDVYLGENVQILGKTTIGCKSFISDNTILRDSSIKERTCTLKDGEEV